MPRPTKPRMLPLEKLARDICWAEFRNPTQQKIGKTKAQYWESLPEITKRAYKEEARRVVWLVRKLHLNPLRFGAIGGPLQYTSLLR